MNANKHTTPPANKYTTPPARKPPTTHPVTPKPTAATNGYIPKYIPPPSPTLLPAPKVETKVEIPSTLTLTTLEDLVSRITANATILFPGIPIKVTTALAPSGLLFHALVCVPKNAERETSRWRVEVRGPAVATEKVAESVGRRRALEELLEVLEKRVGREMLG